MQVEDELLVEKASQISPNGVIGYEVSIGASYCK